LVVNDIAPGTRAVRSLAVPDGAAGGPLHLPLLLARGSSDGPRALVLGGVHGDEPEGISAASAVWRDLDLEVLRGCVLVVPLANPPAWEAGTRESSVDGLNLARVFPGRPTGSLTERIAHALAGLIAEVDLLIDLHSAGLHYAMPFLAGAYAADDDLGQRSLAAARAFGAPVLWAHPDVAPGRSLSVAVEHGITSLYVECGGGGRVRPTHHTAYRQGVRRVLAHVGCLPSMTPPPEPQLVLRGTGDLDTRLHVTEPGLLLEAAGLLDHIHAGQVLGRVIDPWDGRERQVLRAPHDGVVVMARRTARVQRGDGAYMIATRQVT